MFSILNNVATPGKSPSFLGKSLHFVCATRLMLSRILPGVSYVLEGMAFRNTVRRVDGLRIADVPGRLIPVRIRSEEV